jgi:hypothetical protein
MIFRRTFILLTLGLFLPGLLSCSGGGEGGDKIDVFPVSGTIKLGGSPLAGATVMFSPVDPDIGRVATARTNDSGEYQLTTYSGNDGAAPGEYIVIVTKSAQSDSGTVTSHEQYDPNSPGGHSAGKAASDGGAIVPPKYTQKDSSDLRATVESNDDNSFDYDLKL